MSKKRRYVYAFVCPALFGFLVYCSSTSPTLISVAQLRGPEPYLKTFLGQKKIDSHMIYIAVWPSTCHCVSPPVRTRVRPVILSSLCVLQVICRKCTCVCVFAPNCVANSYILQSQDFLRFYFDFLPVGHLR